MSQPSHNTQLVKKINVELVKSMLRTSGTGTKASIAEQTRLSVATCGTILNELVRTGGNPGTWMGGIKWRQTYEKVSVQRGLFLHDLYDRAFRGRCAIR